MKKAVLLIFLLSFICVFPVASLIHGQTSPESPYQMKVLFSPRDNCAQEIVSQIDKAECYVYVAMYYFTSRPIAQTLIRAKNRGVDVKVCMDAAQPHYEYSKSRFLDNKGINIRLIGSSGIMHNKFCVIDDNITITGSYNWTTRADLENDENLMVIKSEKIAKKFKEQFNKFWSGVYVDTCSYKDKDRMEKVIVSMASSFSIAKPACEDRYVGSKNSDKFHYPECKWARKIKEENQIWFNSRQEAINKGYVPCKVCDP